MRNILRVKCKIVFAALIVCSTHAWSVSCDLTLDASTPERLKNKQISSMCVAGPWGAMENIRLIFDTQTSDLHVGRFGRLFFLEKIGREFTPELIGTSGRMRFLPLKLQTFASQGKLLFITSRRSTGGGGGGQCGSGAEDRLSVLDFNQKSPKVIASFLIGSCIDGIELVDIENYAKFTSFWIENDMLNINFLMYDDRCEGRRTAVLDGDFRKLRFVETKKPKN